MKELPTAEEFLESKLGEELSLRGCSALLAKDFLIEFAKLHVQQALQAASESATVVMISNCDDHTPYWGACGSCGRYDNSEVPTECVDANSILNSYPLDKIK